MGDIQESINESVKEAKATYKDSNKSPIDHGYAMVKGIDGRTRLAQELKKNPHVHVEAGGYHGTTIRINGLDRYLTAQKGAYNAFIRSLMSRGIEAEDLYVWTHAD